ncbi:MAG: M56 family metallopeptidase [Candidatus Merdivicinus sp.]|jgi:beta-lactamase regulating signal transducer with metallopeptidase domain
MPIYTIFDTILQMTVTASLCIPVILLIRLFLKKAPRVFSYALWSVVLFRLLCPISFESVLSLIPSTKVVEPTGQTGLPFQVSTNVPAIDTPVNQYLGSHYYEGVTVPEGFSLDLSRIAAVIWLMGCILLLGISLISLFRLRKKLRGAVWEEANIYQARGLETAFVLGFFRPKIYLPEGLSEKERQYILLHEQTHIRRKDYLIRLAAFAALCLHWFNPLVWLAFFVSSRDMEMSCDEAVLKKLGNEVKKDYSTSLLSLASGRRWVGGTPLAFGEGDTKSRIKNVLSYRKPAFWVLIAAVIAVAVTVFLLAANPKESKKTVLESPFGQEYAVRELVYEGPQYSFTVSVESAPHYRLEEDGTLLESNDWSLRASEEEEWTDCGNLEEFSLTAENFDSLFFPFLDGQEEMIENLRQNNDKAWETVRKNGTTAIRYQFLLQKDGGIYLSYGYEGDTASNIRWLFALTTDSQMAADAEWLFNLRTAYIGNNSAVGALLDALNFPQPRNGFSLQTNAQPYGLTVNFNEDASDLLPYEKNAVLLFALIDNLDEITYQFASQAPVYTRDWAEKWIELSDVRVKSEEELFSLLNLLNGIVDGETIDQTSPDGDYTYTGETSLHVDDRTFELEDIPENLAEEAVANYYAWEIAWDWDALTELCSESSSLSNSINNERESVKEDRYMKSYIVHSLQTLTGDAIPSQINTDAKNAGLADYTVVLADIDMTYSDALLAADPQLGEGRYSRIFLCAEKDGSWKLYELYWAEYFNQYSIEAKELETLQNVLSSVAFSSGNLSFTLPENMPAEHPLEVLANIRIADGADGFISYDDLFAEQNKAGWQGGESYSAKVPGSWTEGSTVSMHLRFYKEPEENGTQSIMRWYASWVYQDGKMVRQPWQMETQLRSWTQEENGETVLHFREPYGIDFTLSLTLPQHWAAAPADGLLTGGQVNLFDEFGQPMASIIPSPFTYYPEAAGENFPVSVYSDQMLSSSANWSSEYTPIQQGQKNADGVPVTETATVVIHHTDNGAAGPVIEKPGILSYNLDILRYIAIEFEETVPQETAVKIAESIILSQ